MSCSYLPEYAGTIGVPPLVGARETVTLRLAMKELFQHAATTDGVTVRVAVNFLPEQSHPEAGKWFWVYHIRIENGSHESLKLFTRHWRITDGRGMVNHVDGEGVVGEQPLLSPGQSHDYVSGCPLTTPFGSMEGFYTFQRGDGSPLEVRIPFFPLAAPETADGRPQR
jgi:ApaG protein